MNDETTLIEAVLAEYQQDFELISHASHHAPFNVLGNVSQRIKDWVVLFLPDTISVRLGKKGVEATRVDNTDFFVVDNTKAKLSGPYLVQRVDSQSNLHEFYDPYSFEAQIGELDIHLFAEGKHLHAYRFLGSHKKKVNKVEGILFSLWAPNAKRVSVVGDFNQWDGRRHHMRNRGGSGIWELFIPQLNTEQLYKFEIRSHLNDALLLKSDPYAQQYEMRPNTASIVIEENNYQWQDKNWLENREVFDWQHQPLSIYECHLGSWMRDASGNFLSYRELAHKLADYLKSCNFTHVELLPITEHPFDASWGYQTTGYFAPTSRFGNANEFRYFVDYLHQQNIGVFLDWVPAHFPKDAHGLAKFDGTALYEHEDPRLGEHQDWGTLIYNFSRNEVKNFLISSAVFWLEECHIDGLRVDAVASMLYLDYSRKEGEWIPNQYGGNENIGAIQFLRELNEVTHANFPGTLMMAEESTSWPQVSRPTDSGGLGFSMKWNMGWMHDTLNYFSKNPVHRQYHHQHLTFGLLYLFSENFVLPFSHDEVVHGKSSLLRKMPGDEWQQFANLRLLYTLMLTYPGKKLLFMGGEFAQSIEWNQNHSLDWHLLQYPNHSGIKKCIADLNQLYLEQKPLHQFDFNPKGFEWVDCNDVEQSILSYLRHSNDGKIMVVLNFTPVVRENYCIGTHFEGEFEVLFNSDSSYYSGSNVGNPATIKTSPEPWNNQPYSFKITLPPLAGIVLKIK